MYMTCFVQWPPDRTRCHMHPQTRQYAGPAALWTSLSLTQPATPAQMFLSQEKLGKEILRQYLPK